MVQAIPYQDVTAAARKAAWAAQNINVGTGMPDEQALAIINATQCDTDGGCMCRQDRATNLGQGVMASILEDQDPMPFFPTMTWAGLEVRARCLRHPLYEDWTVMGASTIKATRIALPEGQGRCKFGYTGLMEPHRLLRARL